MTGDARAALAAPVVAHVVGALDGAGVDLAPLWLVGGAVRDALLGRPVLDVDLAVEGDGHEWAATLARVLGGEVVARHRFGTAAVAVPGPVAGADPAVRIDVARTRTETYAHPGALPDVTPAPIGDDLARRDFTVNAMALALGAERRGVLLDPFGGARDTANGVLRVLHDGSFRDDPTRILRGIRYAARHGFAWSDHDRALLAAALAGDALGTVTPGRVGAELVLLALEPLAAAHRALLDGGVGRALHPTLAEPAAVAATAPVLARYEARGGNGSPGERLGLLGAGLRADELQAWLARLAIPRRTADAAVAAARTVALLPSLPVPGQSGRDLHDLLRPCDDDALRLLLLTAPDEALTELRAYRERRARAAPQLRGDDLLALGAPPGPVVGAVLRELADLRLRGGADVTDLEAERALARQLIDRHAEGRGSE